MLQLLFKTPQVEAHEIAQWIKALPHKPGHLSLISGTYINNNKTEQTLPYNPTIPLLDTYSRETKIRVHTKILI